MGPQPLPTRETDVQEAEKAAQVACRKNLVWIVSRQAYQDNQAIPAGLCLISERGTKCQSQKMLLGICLQSMHQPQTVFEILNQSERIWKELLLAVIVVVMDQALFAKAAEIAWKQKELFPNILLRMGTFHTICNALSILGKRLV